MFFLRFINKHPQIELSLSRMKNEIENETVHLHDLLRLKLTQLQQQTYFKISWMQILNTPIFNQVWALWVLFQLINVLSTK